MCWLNLILRWFLKKIRKSYSFFSSIFFGAQNLDFEFSVFVFEGAKIMGLSFVFDALVVWGFDFSNLFMFNFVLMWI